MLRTISSYKRLCGKHHYEDFFNKLYKFTWIVLILNS